MKLAEDHDVRNILVSYYARMSAIQVAMKIIPGAKPPEVSKYLMGIMDWLETTKREHKELEGIANDTVAQALIEDYTLKIYNVAYQCDCNGKFTKNVVKAYYTAGLLCEVLQQFGPLSEEIEEKGKISKYRATYIHNMLKQGLPPQRINVTVVDSDEQEAEHMLTHDEINERRKQRGEDPLPPRETSSEDIPFMMPNMNDDSEPNYQPETMAPEKIIDDGEPSNPILPSAGHQFSNVADNIMRNFRDQPPDEPKRPAPTSFPQVPQPTSSDASSVAVLDPDQTEKAVKYCKWASSALNYDDIGTAIVNLERALHLCRFGQEKP